VRRGNPAAQEPQQPPVRQIGTILAVSHDTLASVASAVQVAGGKVYVNDILAHQVLLYDSTLGAAQLIADSAGETANPYGSMPATLLPYHGDSALLVTPSSLSMLVLGPAGATTHVLAMPPSGVGTLPSLIGSIFGTPGFDAHGRLTYFSPVRMQFRGPPPTNGPMAMEPPDSALIVRFDLATRALDTAGTIHIPRSHMSVSRDDQGHMHMTMTAFPPQPIDAWAVTSDGAIAIVRGLDFHIDWINPDGSRTSSGRIPFAWQHLDDDQKTALIDSVQGAMQAFMDSMPARMQRQTGQAGGTAQTREQRGPGGGGSMTVIIAGPGGGDAPPPGGPGRGAPGNGTTTISMATPTVEKASPADVPDYRPPFEQGAVRADADGNLWVRTTTLVDGRPVYDVVNRGGQLVDRVQLPPFRTIAGFGPGVLYMAVKDSAGTAHVERARIR